MRCVGVDFGGVRIGTAVGEKELKVASTRPVIKASGTLASDAAKIVELVRSEQAQAVVVGLPLDANGETRMSGVCRKLGEHIESLGVTVFFVDESFTSAESERDMVESGLKGSERRHRSDSLAACKILERFFEQAH